MKTEIKQRLIDALESGNYKQTTGALNRVSIPENAPVKVGHCCLGVLCELAVEDGIIQRRLEGSFGDYGTEDEFENSTWGESMPPKSVADWAGLTGKYEGDASIWFDMTEDESKLEEISELKPWMWNRIPGKLILGAHELNDEYRYTFQDIADLLKSDRIVKADWQ